MDDLSAPQPVRFADLKPDVENDKGLIFSFKDEIDPMSTVDVYVNQDTVIVKTNTHTTGQTIGRDGAQKTWHKWKTTKHVVYSLKKQKFGKPLLRIYNVTKPRYARRTQIRDITAAYLNGKVNSWGFGTSFNSETLNSALRDGIIPRYSSRNSVFDNPTMFALWHVFKKYSERNPDFKFADMSALDALVVTSYPATELFGENFSVFASDLSFASGLWLGEPDLRPWIRKGFGKNALRKDFIKALSKTTSASAINLVHHLKGVVPIDWLIKLLQTPEEYIVTSGFTGKLLSQSFMSHHHLKYLRWFFKQLTPAQQKRFLLEKKPDNIDGYWTTLHTRDALYMLKELTEPTVLEHLEDLMKSSTWEQLHGNLIILKRDSTLKPQPVPQTGITAELDETTFASDGITYTIRSPKMNQELIRWGNELNNCIASYSDRVVKEYTKVFAVYKEDGALYANLEVQENRLIQFVEKNNRSVSYEMRDQMGSLINKAHKKVSRKKSNKGTVGA